MALDYARRDLVISKLAWAKETMSPRQLADIRAILASGLVEEDAELLRWVSALGLEAVMDASRTTRYDE